MSISEMMQAIGLKSRKRFRENYMIPALADKAIVAMYPNISNHPQQKYKLTEEAKEWKDNENK